MGELAAKLLTVGGAAVTITWRQGVTEAKAIAAEADALGLMIEALPFDIAAPPERMHPPMLRSRTSTISRLRGSRRVSPDILGHSSSPG